MVTKGFPVSVRLEAKAAHSDENGAIRAVSVFCNSRNDYKHLA
jgi:hypothetical protein